MEQPEGSIDENLKGKVCLLKKSLYGLPQSGRCWNERLDKTLIEIGLERLTGDPCVYRMKIGSEIIIIGIYVDDFIVVGSSVGCIDILMKRIAQEFEIKESPEISAFLGLKIKETKDGFELSQEHYIDRILEKFGLSECKPVKSPGDIQQKLDGAVDSKSVDPTIYREMLGSLMYLSVGTRPDITFQVSCLSQFCQDPRLMHLTAIKRIYRYLKGTRNDIQKNSWRASDIYGCKLEFHA